MPLPNRLGNNSRVSSRNWLEYLAVFGISAIVMAVFMYNADVPDGDSFYHARFTALMFQHGFIETLPWLQETSLSTSFADHHLVYHVLLLPLLWFMDPLLAATVGQVLLVAGLMTTVYAIAKKQGLPYAWVIPVVLAGIWPFMIRMTLIKASPLAILVLLLITYALLKRSAWWVPASVTVVYTMVHGGFPLVFVVAFAVWLGRCVASSWEERRVILASPIELWPLVLGAVIGIVANPYFPHNLQFYWLQFVQIGVVNYQDAISVGAEWYPFAPSELVGSISVLMTLALLSIIVIVRNRARYTSDAVMWGLGILTVILFVATLRSRRFVEYLVPIMAWWCAYILLPYVKSGAWRDDLNSLYRLYNKKLIIVVIGYVVLGTVVAYGKTIYKVYDHLRNDAAYAVMEFQGAALAVAEHSQPGEVVFHTNWDHFPMLFYHNWENYYLVGLDATFMYLESPTQYQRWQDIVHGKYKIASRRQILRWFNAPYVVVEKKRTSGNLLAAYLLRDDKAEQIYEDEYTRVFYLKK